MQTEEKKDTDKKTRGDTFGCCKPENYEEMFAMMSKCCPRPNNATDFSAMMKNMMDMYTESKTNKTQPDGADS